MIAEPVIFRMDPGIEADRGNTHAVSINGYLLKSSPGRLAQILKKTGLDI
jgi:hypothetical protein